MSTRPLKLVFNARDPRIGGKTYRATSNGVTSKADKSTMMTANAGLLVVTPPPRTSFRHGELRLGEGVCIDWPRATDARHSSQAGEFCAAGSCPARISILAFSLHGLLQDP
jgi:hypothetical protein